MNNRILSFALVLLCSFFQSYGQVGVNTTTPEGALDVLSSNSGVVLPRIALLSITDNTTVVNPQGTPLAEGTIVFNTGTGGLTASGYYFWNGTTWVSMFAFDNTVQSYMGKAIISSTGTVTITGIPFEPKSVRFTAYSNVDAFTLNADNQVGNNQNVLSNAFGYMRGYAQETAVGTIEQQVIYGGGSGASINDISRYASPLHCIGLRYSNNNGDSFGITSAILTSFTADGFVLDVDSAIDPVVIIYEAFIN